jgi:FkbM family methyltransferase
MDVPEPSPPILTNGHLRLRRCRHGIMLYNLNDTHLGTMLDLYGEYSEAEADMFRHFLKPGMTAVEVGANIGAHTLALAGIVGRQGRVLAFEPQRVVFQMLCANLAVNGIEHVDAHWAAVGSAPGTITVPRVSGTERANFGGLAAGGAQGDEVRLLTLDGFALPACDFLKIDVEGMEQDVLLGARKTIDRLRPTISVENDREEKSPALIQALWDLDYDCYWDIPRYIHVPNFRGNTESIFPTMSSFNLVCVPRDKERRIGGLRKVEGTLDAWPPLEAWLRTTDAPAINNRGTRLHELKRFEQAITLFDRAIELAPRSAIAFVNRGNSLAALQRVDEALADYERALALEPDNVQARENREALRSKLVRQPERDDRKGD